MMNSAALRHPVLTALALASGLVLAGTQSASAMIVNGDFSGGTAGTYEPGAAMGASNSVPTGWTGFDTANLSLRVLSDTVVFNGGNTAPGSYIQQTAGTSNNAWYELQWDHQDGPGSFPARAVSSVQIWDGPTATGAPTLGDRRVRFPTANIPHVFRAPSSQTTFQFGDLGSNTSSNDVQIDNVSLALANGPLNVAPSLGTATASSTHGSFGTNPQSAVDGSSNFSDGSTNFHSGGIPNEWWRLDFSDTLGVVSRVEVQARSGFNDRNGDFFDLIDEGGNIIDTLSVTDGALFAADGMWRDVAAIEVRNGPSASETLNLAEVRVFAEFLDGALVSTPEPGSLVLLGSGLAGLALARRRRRR